MRTLAPYYEAESRNVVGVRLGVHLEANDLAAFWDFECLFSSSVIGKCAIENVFGSAFFRTCQRHRMDIGVSIRELFVLHFH